MWTLYIDDDQNNRTTLKLAQAEYSIGRADGSAIRLAERNISREHAKLVQDSAGRWTLTDLDSDNGCFVNGRRITSTPLAHSDFIQLGDYRARISDNDIVRTKPEAEDDTLRAVPQAANVEADRLVVIVGVGTGSVYPLHGGSILIGRGDECEIALTDTSVSRVHAEVVGTPEGYELIDRGSANGLHVNGVGLTRTFLQPSDVIELGDVLLKFVPKGELLVNADAAHPALAQDHIETPLAPSVSPLASRSRFTTVGPLLMLLLLVGAFVVVRERREAPAQVAVVPAKPVNPAELVLQEAKRLHLQGNLTQAHETLQKIPSDSNLRQVAAVAEIESSWADTMFEMVANEPDVASKKALLSSIAATEGISSAQRKRAAAQLQSLEAPSVEVTELPVEDEPLAPQPAKTASSRKISRGSSAPVAAPSAIDKPKPTAPPPGEPAAPEPEDELIRKAPF